MHTNGNSVEFKYYTMFCGAEVQSHNSYTVFSGIIPQGLFKKIFFEHRDYQRKGFIKGTFSVLISLQVQKLFNTKGRVLLEERPYQREGIIPENTVGNEQFSPFTSIKITQFCVCNPQILAFNNVNLYFYRALEVLTELQEIFWLYFIPKVFSNYRILGP